jgi:putative addiction module component (TIGR02574 family)
LVYPEVVRKTGELARCPFGGFSVPPTLEALGIDRLSVEDRIALAMAIWDSVIEQPHGPLLTEAQRQELQRRLDDDNARPDDVIPWEQIKAEALARHRQ